MVRDPALDLLPLQGQETTGDEMEDVMEEDVETETGTMIMMNIITITMKMR